MCDEGSALLKLLGQIGTNKKTTNRVTFNSNVLYQEYSEESDEIIETLSLCETNDDGNLDITINRIQNEISHIEVEIKDFNSNSAKLSRSLFEYMQNLIKCEYRIKKFNKS